MMREITAQNAFARAATILLVESAQDDREMYATYLRALRFRTIEVDDTAALTAATAADVVVTGISVPGPFDGIELVRRLRASMRMTDLPPIVLTAHVTRPDREVALAAGADAFVTKPCVPQQLERIIRRVLRRRRRTGKTLA